LGTNGWKNIVLNIITPFISKRYYQKMKCKAITASKRRCPNEAMLFGVCIRHQPKSDKEVIKITPSKKFKPMEEIEKWN